MPSSTSSKKTGESENDLIVKDFCRRAGIVFPSSVNKLWERVERKLGSDYAETLLNAIDARAYGHTDEWTQFEQLDVYDVLFWNLDSALATVPFATPMLRAWMSHFLTVDLPRGPLIDLGSGSGILTCFYASVRPESTVVGIEINPRGVACGRALAERLSLPNVSFVNTDALDFTSVVPASVVTSVACITEVESVDWPASNVFSDFNSVKSGWGRAESRLAHCAARILADGGVYLSLERLPGFFEIGMWASSLQSAGLPVDPSVSTSVSWSGPPVGRQRMPAFIARKTEEHADLTFDCFLDWWQADNKNAYPDFDVERSLLQTVDAQFINGKHFDVLDGHGRGMTRLYALSVNTEAVLYMTTSRGLRKILLRSANLDEVLSQMEDMTARFASSDEVVGTGDLTVDDFAQDLR